MRREIKSALFWIKKGEAATLPLKTFEYLIRRTPRIKDFVNSYKVNTKIERLLRSHKNKKAEFENISVVYFLKNADQNLLSRSIFSLKKLVVNPHVIIVDLGENEDKIWNVVKNYLPKATIVSAGYDYDLNEVIQKVAKVPDIKEFVLLLNEFPKFNELVNLLDNREYKSEDFYTLDFIYPRREIKNYYIDRESISFYENLNLYRTFFPLISCKYLDSFNFYDFCKKQFKVLPAALTIKELNKNFDSNNIFKTNFEMINPSNDLDNHPNIHSYILPFEGKVSIIILTKDKVELLSQCLKSIETSTYRNYEIIIVDHDSTSESKQYFKSLPYKVIPYSGVYNFSKMNNLAAKEALGDVYCFLNNDTEVITHNWMEILSGFACQPDIGAVGAKLLFKNHLIQHAGIRLNRGLDTISHILTYEKDNNLSKELKLLSSPHAVTGACMFVEREKFWSVGGFDESYMIIWQDIDLCLKLDTKGQRTLLIPYAKLYHHESMTRRFEPSENEKHDIVLFKSKWGHLYEETTKAKSFNLERLKDFGSSLIKRNDKSS
jgi:GT2 family glycosyltransferase